MKLKRVLIIEGVVAGVTLLAAGAFTQASVNGQTPWAITVEQTADAIGRKLFSDECVTCHADAPRPAEGRASGS